MFQHVGDGCPYYLTSLKKGESGRICTRVEFKRSIILNHFKYRALSIMSVYTSTNACGKSVHARDTIQKNSIIFSLLETARESERDIYSIEYKSTNYRVCEPAIYVNHSCDPNCYIDTEFRMRALRDIPENGELTFDYTTTESTITQPFNCKCGSKCCKRYIR